MSLIANPFLYVKFFMTRVRDILPGCLLNSLEDERCCITLSVSMITAEAPRPLRVDLHVESELHIRNMYSPLSSTKFTGRPVYV